MYKVSVSPFKAKKILGVRHFSRIVDTFIVGGETPGIATATALSKSDFFEPDDKGNKRIVLLNQREVPKLNKYTHSAQQKLPDKRVITIAYSTLQMLHSLGALDKMNHLLVTPYRKMFVNEAFGRGKITFDDDFIDQSYLARTQQDLYDKYINKHDYHFYGKNSLGASVEYDHIHSAMYDLLLEQEKCEIIDNDSIRYIRPAKSLNKLTEIELKSGLRFHAKLVIGNDGGESYVRDVHNIESSAHDYNQKCILRTMIHQQPLPGAFQRFLATGPI